MASKIFMNIQVCYSINLLVIFLGDLIQTSKLDNRIQQLLFDLFRCHYARLLFQHTLQLPGA